MRFNRNLIVGGFMALALTTSTGCGSSDSSTSATSEAGPTTTTTTAATESGNCSGTKATITDLETGETAELDNAGGVSLSGGAAYTVYLADSEINSDEISFVKTPEPVPGHHLVTVAITVFNAEGTPEPITVGEKIEFTPDFGVLTFRVIDDTVERSANSSAEAEGDITMTSVGEKVCFTIDYTDDEKTLTGTVEASVKDL